MKKLFQFLTGDIFKTIGKIVDDVVTTKEEKEEIKARVYQMLLTASLQSDALRASIIIEEAKGNWLQRSWRPIIMLAFASIVVFQKFLYPLLRAFIPELPVLPPLEADFWTLLQIGIGGYVVGRTAEKIVPQLNEIRLNRKEKKRRNAST